MGPRALLEGQAKEYRDLLGQETSARVAAVSRTLAGLDFGTYVGEESGSSEFCMSNLELGDLSGWVGSSRRVRLQNLLKGIALKRALFVDCTRGPWIMLPFMIVKS